MSTFIADLRDSGAPLGPFAQPRDLWRLPSGRGKVHRTKWCRQDAEQFQGLLVDHAESLCNNCEVEGTTDPEYGWEQAIAPYVEALAAVANPTKDATKNAAVIALAYAHARKHELLFRGIRAVDDWVPTHAVPVLEQALAALEPDRVPAHTPDGLIRATASAGTASAMRKGVDLYLKALRDPSTGDHAGQDGIIGFLVNRADKVYRTRTDLDEVKALLKAHAEMLLGDIDTFKSLKQVDVDAALPDGDFTTIQELLDAAWRARASIELAILTEAFIAAAEEARAEIAAEPEHWYLFSHVEQWGANATIVDTVFTTLLEYRLDDYLVVKARPSIYKWTKDMAKASYEFETDLGPVADRDALETIKHAVHLRSEFGDDEVLDIARNVLS